MPEGVSPPLIHPDVAENAVQTEGFWENKIIPENQVKKPTYTGTTVEHLQGEELPEPGPEDVVIIEE